MKYFIIFLLLYNSLFAAEIKIEVFGKQNLEKLRFSSPKDCEEIGSRISPTSKHFIGKSNPSFCSDFETPKFLTYRSLESTYFYEKVVKIDEYDSSCDLTKESNYFDLCVYSSSCPAGTIPTDKEPYCECPDGEIWNDDMTACIFDCSSLNPNILLPDDTWVYSSLSTSEEECSSKVNGKNYIGSNYFPPKPEFCPEVKFCFLKLALPEQDDDNDGIPNRCDKDYLNYAGLDCDGDGDPNESDLDDDGDGNIDNDGSGNDNNSSNVESDICSNVPDTATIKYYGSQYSKSDYVYYGKNLFFNLGYYCKDLIVKNDNVSGVYTLYDINSACEVEYCYIYQEDFDCSTLNPLDYKPHDDGSWYYRSNVSEIYCNNLVDNDIYTASKFITPNLNKCPSTGFCFLKEKPINNDDDNTTLADDNDNNSSKYNPQIDKTNKQLEDLNEKMKKNNEYLSDLLTSNQGMKSTLDKLNINSKNSLKNQISNLEKLSNINNELSDSNNKLKDLTKIGINSNNKLNNINNKLNSININQQETIKTLNRGLFGDDPFADADFSDSGINNDTLSGYSTTVSSSFDGFYETNVFQLATVAPVEIQTYSFNLLGRNYVILDASTFNQLPINQIRALIMFIFALAGFITVIRTV